MRFVALLRATPQDEGGESSGDELLAGIGRFSEVLERAGVLLAGEGLRESSRGARVHFVDGDQTVTDGPFAGPNERLAGFWILQARDLAEAIEWVRRAPLDPGSEVEIRQVVEAPD